MSELFTGSTTLKLVNTLNEAQMKAILSYQGLSTFQLAIYVYIESVRLFVFQVANISNQ